MVKWYLDKRYLDRNTWNISWWKNILILVPVMHLPSRGKKYKIFILRELLWTWPQLGIFLPSDCEKLVCSLSHTVCQTCFVMSLVQCFCWHVAVHWPFHVPTQHVTHIFVHQNILSCQLCLHMFAYEWWGFISQMLPILLEKSIQKHCLFTDNL